ncbi:hypothetical protein V1227_18755 [Lentzea sp. DG1S-22]|uniref:hypothetical protein n=1 Tax=unclassified Lentzea TaxID=2643253 RepID=UPI00224B1BDE|nr:MULTISPECIES: hypothetical protein [unclassified Lentzea]MCX2949911.1 hypothetical protein [Lentzea sp. NEAU-D7]WVH84696.1 hypothetical protein V1227_18755 [Lentzea sp. DG1S-22]
MQHTIQERFQQFHLDNPEVFEALERLAGEWFSAGMRKLGVKMLWETMRWERSKAAAPGTFALNDAYTSRYARELVNRHPEWAPYIELRELRAA